MPLVRSVACHGRTILTRLFASCPPLNATNFNTTNPYQVFDRAVKRHQRDTAASINGGIRSATVDYVRDEAAERLMERFKVRSSAL